MARAPPFQTSPSSRRCCHAAKIPSTSRCAAFMTVHTVFTSVTAAKVLCDAADTEYTSSVNSLRLCSQSCHHGARGSNMPDERVTYNQPLCAPMLFCSTRQSLWCRSTRTCGSATLCWTLRSSPPATPCSWMASSRSLRPPSRSVHDRSKLSLLRHACMLGLTGYSIP